MKNREGKNVVEEMKEMQTHRESDPISMLVVVVAFILSQGNDKQHKIYIEFGNVCCMRGRNKINGKMNRSLYLLFLSSYFSHSLSLMSLSSSIVIIHFP